MASITIDIEPTILSWVMNIASFEISDNKVRDNIGAWIRGDKKPTFNQIEGISKATHVPLGYFFLKKPPTESLPILEYRTIDSIIADNPSRAVVDTIFYLENIQEWMRDYRIDSGIGPLSIIGSQRKNSNPQEIADAIRKDVNLNAEWYLEYNGIREAFNALRKLLSNSGIIILMNGIVANNTHRPLNIEEFRAVTLIDEYAPLIFINANDTLSGKLFSLIHEAVHIWIGKNNFFNNPSIGNNKVNPLETLCNAVAAEILVPNQLFVSKWADLAKGNSVQTVIKTLSKLFNCGTTIIARRALDNAFISNAQYQEIAQNALNQYREEKSRKDGGGDYYATTANRLDRNLVFAIDNSIREGKTSYTDAYRLTNTTRKTFPTLVKALRGANNAGE